MLSEHELETIEKLFPNGCLTVWVLDKPKGKAAPKPKGKPKKYGIYCYNPKQNEALESALNLLLNRPNGDS